MKISRTSAGIGALAAMLTATVAVIPALGQDKPESLLPPGFDEPATPAPAPAPAPAPTRAPEAGTPAPLPSLPLAGGDLGNGVLGNESAGAELPPVDLTRYELPDYARRTLTRIGTVADGNAPFPADAFGNSDGRYLEGLMRRLDAPVASRWLSIALRRALISRAETPRNSNPVDFAAERGWLLLKMGEAVGARSIVQDVDVENYTPKMFQLGAQTALATGDPAGLCPMAEPASRLWNDRGWAYARVMCAGLAGKPNEAGQLLKAAQGQGHADSIDTLLAEKVMGTGAQGRRAVTIEWDNVQRLTSWRYGLATATGVEVPEALYATAGIQVRYWRALSPALDPVSRARSAELAAAQGVFSNAGLVDLYGEIEQGDTSSSPEMATARDLRSAYTAATPSDRMTAMRALWSAPEMERLRYARLVLTARAAASIAPGTDRAQDADQLVASMLTAGLAHAARPWQRVVSRGGEGWALLALADDTPGAQLSYNDVELYRGAKDVRKAQLFFAGLAGLGKLSDGDSQRMAATLDVGVGAANAWTLAIDRAAERRDPGTVVLLAAVGMQTRNWANVTPEALFHIVAALRYSGLEDYARMIAVEAVTRG